MQSIFDISFQFVFFRKYWNMKTGWKKTRFLSVCYLASDRARRENSIQGGLASRRRNLTSLWRFKCFDISTNRRVKVTGLCIVLRGFLRPWQTLKRWKCTFKGIHARMSPAAANAGMPGDDLITFDVVVQKSHAVKLGIHSTDQYSKHSRLVLANYLTTLL